jgi:hypothetical protein
MDSFNKCLEVEKVHQLMVNNHNQLLNKQLPLEAVKLKSLEELVTKVKITNDFSKI